MMASGTISTMMMFTVKGMSCNLIVTCACPYTFKLSLFTFRNVRLVGDNCGEDCVGIWLKILSLSRVQVEPLSIRKSIGISSRCPLTYKPLSQTSLLLVPFILHVKPCPSSSWVGRISSAGSWPNETTDGRFPAVLFVGWSLQSYVHLVC